MQNRFILALLISIPLVFAVPAAQASTAPSAPKLQTTQAAFGRGLGRRSPSFGTRPRARSHYPSRYRTRTSRRPRRGFGHVVGGVLKALGVAYLFHMLFGWGAGGGSPFGLLLLIALLAYAVGRTRGRRPMRY
jgi:predicted lipid-binding transport protein (Tim44 family)